jgi:hypothetical protein
MHRGLDVITSWYGFVYAVDEMLRLQEQYRATPEEWIRQSLMQKEIEVSACTQRKIREWGPAMRDKYIKGEV